jgi:hypothetical protein
MKTKNQRSPLRVFEKKGPETSQVPEPVRSECASDNFVFLSTPINASNTAARFTRNHY